MLNIAAVDILNFAVYRCFFLRVPVGFALRARIAVPLCISDRYKIALGSLEELSPLYNAQWCSTHCTIICLFINCVFLSSFMPLNKADELNPLTTGDSEAK